MGGIFLSAIFFEEVLVISSARRLLQVLGGGAPREAEAQGAPQRDDVLLWRSAEMPPVEAWKPSKAAK